MGFKIDLNQEVIIDILYTILLYLLNKNNSIICKVLKINILNDKKVNYKIGTLWMA